MSSLDFSEQALNDIPIVVLDTETTGLYPGLGHRVIEIGAVRYENGRPVAEYEQLLDPERPIDPKASAVNGIEDADLQGKPRFAQIRPELDALLDGALLVAHNASFDADFMGLEYRLSSPQAEHGRLLLNNPWLCTLQLARRYFHFGRNNLAFVAQKLQVRVGRAHRALNDVFMTAEVLFRMNRHLAKTNGFRTVGDLLYAQGGAIYSPPPMRIPLPDLVETALATGGRLEILYLGRSEGESRRQISPRYAAFHQDVPYLIAFCHLRQDVRTFRIDRILGATLL